MCPMFLRLLLYMYTHQKLRVKWNGICSELFDVTNVVKQAGILSPLLFCIYIDVLDWLMWAALSEMYMWVVLVMMTIGVSWRHLVMQFVKCCPSV